jgi:DNA-directed RNA polymerase subunit M/transcription elongation factor TFIIS
MFESFGCVAKYSQALTKLAGDDYELKQKIAYNLQLNGAFLTNRYTPAEFVTLNDDTLAEKSEIEKEKDTLAKCYDTYRNLLTFDFLQAEGIGAGDYIKCRFCGKGNVNFTTKQTRGADEGSTVFLACSNPKCRKRWKM